MGYYVRRGEKIIGPIEVPKLKELVAQGKVLPTDELTKDVANGPWQQAGRTTLFAKPTTTELAPKPEPPRPAVVAKAEVLPAVIEPQATSSPIAKVTTVVF